MTIRELSSNEIEHGRTIKDLNKRREFVQNLAVTEFAKNKLQIINHTTGTGKSYIIYYSIKRMQARFGTLLPYIVIVPTTKLLEDFKELLKEFDNVHIYIINTYVKHPPFAKIQAIFCDEGHRILGENSQHFNKALSIAECSYKMILSATLDSGQLEFAASLGFKNRFILDNSTALKLQLIPDYKTYNLLLDLLPKEKKEYDKIEASYKDYIFMFSKVQEHGTGYFISSCLSDRSKAEYAAKILDLDVGVILGSCRRWFSVMNKRKQLLYKSKAKYVALEQILELIKFRQTLVYVSTQKEAEEIARKSHLRGSYYGNKSTQVINDFDKERIHTLISVNKITEGQVTDNVEFVIRLNFTTKERAYLQSSGRAKRFDKNNPDKVGITINLIIKDSQDESWIKSQTKNEKFLLWIDSIEEIEELYET